MDDRTQLRNLIFGLSLGGATAALAIVFMLIVAATQPAQAQTFNVLYNFTGAADGKNPYAGLTMDKAGNLYGTASAGGLYGGNCHNLGCGTLFRLSHAGWGWLFTPLYTFQGGDDGATPVARVIFGPNGTLYGTTSALPGCCLDTVFNLRPRPRACTAARCPWTETSLYTFSGGADGAFPEFGDLIFDQTGNIYGTTASGGNGLGVVYELAPSGSGWTQSILYTFTRPDGARPQNGVVFDNAGNLYGTTLTGGNLDCNDGYGCGAIFQLTPAGSGWVEHVLYTFQKGSDGTAPYAGLTFDPSGNLYGTTSTGGTGGGGTVFKLTPSNGSWTYSLVYSFTGRADFNCGPWGTLVMDGAGNLYGTTVCDGANRAGNVWELTPSENGWTYTSLHDFTGGSDGAEGYCKVSFDPEGNLYGTTFRGGSDDVGVIWEITP